MISRVQNTISKERSALGEISESNNQYSAKNTSQAKDLKNKYAQNQVNLNGNEMDRLKQLKSKYNKSNSIQNIENLPSYAKSQPIDTSFKPINLENFTKYNSNNQQKQSKLQQKSSNQTHKTALKSPFLKDHYHFDHKIQQSSQRLESNIHRVQDKLNTLKLSYQKNHSYPQNLPSYPLSSLQPLNQPKPQSSPYQSNPPTKEPQINQNSQSLHFSLKKQHYTKYDQSLEESSSKRAYAQQLKSINFIDQIQKKIQAIENETKTNLQKKTSQITKNSHTPNNKYQECPSLSNKQQKITLANFVPHLAQSQVIETTQRERLTDKNLPPKIQYIESFVFQNYKFSQESSQTKPIFSDKILQDPQVQEMSIRASPALVKSPFGETNLEETQMIQRNSLQGDLEIFESEIQGEFVLLINRLAYQAEIDNRFASEIFKYDNVFTQNQSLKSIILARLKQHYAQNRLKFDEKMFQVSQMELDPLATVEKIHKDFSLQEIMKVGFGLKKLYDKNTYYFESKLHSFFSHKTIEFLIDQLQKCHSLKTSEEINVGHLTSYVNMRTGRNLRNRYFYRILKRIVRNNTKIGSTFKRDELFQAFVKK